MSGNLSKRIKERSVALSDLDGLLVNSHNFDQVFIKRIDPEWMTATIQRVVKSEQHLKRLIQVLVKFIVSDKHPDWVHHALAWLTHLFHSPEFQRSASTPDVQEACRPLVSYATEMAGMQELYTRAYLRGIAVEKWAKGSSSYNRVPRQLYYGGAFDVPSTGYVYVDDSDEEFGQRLPNVGTPKANPTEPSENNIMTDTMEMDHFGDVTDDKEHTDDTTDYDDDDDDDDIIDQSDLESDDHGVFDVNETASSDDPLIAHDVRGAAVTSHQSNVLPAEDKNEAVQHPASIVTSDQNGDEDHEASSELDEVLDFLMWTGMQTDDSLTNSDIELSDTAAPSNHNDAQPSTSSTGRPVGQEMTSIPHHVHARPGRKKNTKPTRSVSNSLPSAAFKPKKRRTRKSP